MTIGAMLSALRLAVDERIDVTGRSPVFTRLGRDAR